MAASTRRRRINFKVGRLVKATRAATSKALDVVAREMTAELKDLLNTSHPPASAPGSPPHRRTGTLRSKTEVIRNGRKLIVRTTQVGIFLEGGTQNMAARPHIRPTIQDEGQKWRRRINAEIRRNMKKNKRR